MGVAKATAGRVGNRSYILVAGADAATGATFVLQLNFGRQLLPHTTTPPPSFFFYVSVDFQLLKASKHHDMQIGFLKTT